MADSPPISGKQEVLEERTSSLKIGNLIRIFLKPEYRVYDFSIGGDYPVRVKGIEYIQGIVDGVYLDSFDLRDSLMFLDEPTNSRDITSRRFIPEEGLIKNLSRDSIFLITFPEQFGLDRD